MPSHRRASRPAGRPAAIARRINEEYNVEGLCREFPGRIQKLIDLDGGNLTK